MINICKDKLSLRNKQIEVKDINNIKLFNTFIDKKSYTKLIGIKIWTNYLKLHYTPHMSYVYDFIF